jgi:hypothetical protein
MTAQTASPRRTRRVAVAAIAVTMLVAAGGYVAARTIGGTSREPVAPSQQVMRDYHDTVVGLYGPEPAPIAPSDEVMRELRKVTIALNGPQR